MARIVSDTKGMIAEMMPALQPGEFLFWSATDPISISSCIKEAIGMFVEGEGISLILPLPMARARGIVGGVPMRQITLQVHSALEGVGLTAAVATELTRFQIPCNVVAAYHHDHLFVPSDRAEQALEVLQALQASYRTRQNPLPT
jgi:hypothetical protein